MNKDESWDRRQFLSSLTIAATAAPTILRASTSMSSQNILRCRLLDFAGEPVKPQELQRFYICDLLSEPIAIDPVFAAGEVSFVPVSKPFRIGVSLKIPGFGQVFLYADNRGQGYDWEVLGRKNPLFLNYEFAADRLVTVRRLLEESRRAGFTIAPATRRRAEEASKFLKKAEEADPNGPAATKWAMESLRESLWGGELIVLERAQQTIERRGPRPGFLFGCNCFGYPDSGQQYAKHFESAFNFATLPFYRTQVERFKGGRDYSHIDRLLEWLVKTGIKCKGHPLVWLLGETTPDWLKNRPFEETKTAWQNYVRDSILRFRSHIPIWDVINEAHVQPEVGTGVQGFTREQNVELTCVAARTAREADPTCYRLVNNTGTWGDYYLGRNPAIWQQSVYAYLQMLKEARCDYDAIGLQYYHSGRDLVELERDIEKFKSFGKPIHITELGIPSSSDETPGNEWWGGGIGGAGMAWHGEHFTEAIQADWVESVYSIFFSRPFVEAITWWDLADKGSFIPYGGLLRPDLMPKEGFNRLLLLRNRWTAHG
jgi:endo-1,4-beta-xylanase